MYVSSLYYFTTLGETAHYAYNRDAGYYPPTNTGITNCDDGGFLTPRVHNLFNQAHGIDVGTTMY